MGGLPQQQLFEAWNRMDPVDEWELERNRRIAAIQGNGNPYVSNEELPLGPRQLTETIFSEPMTEFRCDERKNCGQMTSCEEAYFHFLQCGNGRLDGDSDEVPCNSICH
ncbi:endonuclease [Halomonas citrativorans]|uniref:endonuclease n=1 Tax=Halomonas citrativorans TaxID=2742612 RepID=UPI000B364A74|nr:excalibur calcium-binding domain-containing protein [Halomonas citrativorans]